jgi:hypothetical protein
MERAAAWRRSSIPLSSPSEVRFSSADRFFHVFDRLPEANYLTGLANLPPLELGGGEAARLFLALRNMPDNTELGLNRRSRPFPWAERTLSLSVSTLLTLVALTVLLATASYWHPAAAPRTNATAPVAFSAAPAQRLR